MRKLFCSAFCMALMLLSACSAPAQPQLPQEETAAASTEVILTTEPSLETTAPEETFSFESLKFTTFRFSSGAGGWGTNLVICPDGSFTGDFYDSNMGIVEAEYPNGSVSLSSFAGRFSAAVKVDEYTYALKLEPLSYAVPPGTVEIRDGIQYCYGDAYGLANTEELLLYLPGAPLSELPEDFLLWANLFGAEESLLPFFGLYDPTEGNGFYSFSILEEIRSQVAAAESKELYWSEAANQEYATQTDMNIAADQRYQCWDRVLNSLWSVLKRVLEKDAMDRLTREELAWIREKEQAVAEAGAQVEGGSMYPTVTYGTAARMTRERVYALLEYLPEEE